MNPRTLWACQPVVFISSARLAPLVRLINSRTFAPLLSGRRVAASLVRAALGAFLGLASFGAAALAFFAAFGPLGAAVFWLAPLLRGGLLRRDVRALCRNGGGLFGGGGFFGRHGDLGSFLRAFLARMTIHHSAVAHKQVNCASSSKQSGR